MKKINNHGLTAVEVIICFSITAVIVISLFKVISNYNDKQYIESNKNQIITYKNVVTKSIQSDILKNGGIKSISPSDFNDKYDEMYNNKYFNINFYYNNGQNARLYFDLHENYEYILFSNSERVDEKYPLSDIGNGVIFNEPRIDYDEDNELLNIYVGINHPDLGDKYAVLDLTLPLTSKWSNLY